MVRQGSFREDLYYRLKVVEIMLPPLRERRQCIPLLVYHFLDLFREKIGRKINTISDQAMESLTRYAWPGNVRELRHVMERACILCNGATLLRENLPVDLFRVNHDTPAVATSAQAVHVPDARPTGIHLGPSEADMVRQALLQSGGNKSRAAKLLQVDRSTLYRKMRRYNLS
jgi:transcriptional regulator with PAS, ATPase and Fis domain